jgi:hypothetical protein
MAQMRNIPTRKGDPALRAVLQSLLVTELIAHSQKLFLISPWISDIPILDNRAGQYRSLVPEWELAQIRFSKVLTELADRGTKLIIASRPSDSNPFFKDLVQACSHLEKDRVTISYSDELHEKGLLTDRFYFAGSFNFTLNGIEVLEEVANLFTDREVIGQKRVDLEDRWEGKS